MSLAGSIAVAVEFRNSTTATGVQSLKTIELRDTTAYTAGKVAIVSGTVGTAAASLWNGADGSQLDAFGGYRDASGQPVTFTTVSRIALRGSGTSGVVIEDSDLSVIEMLSVGNQIAVGNHNGGQHITIRTLGGTASFTAVLYGP